jgi:hypothetical protein
MAEIASSVVANKRTPPTREEVLAKIKECEDKAELLRAAGSRGTAWLWERAAKGWRRYARKHNYISEER